MTKSAFPTRRSALRLGVLGLAALAVAPAARAAPLVRFPLRLAYVRVGQQGFVPIRSDEQAVWTGLATRLSGLVDMIAPLQTSSMLAGGAPKVAGGANCAMVARQMAAQAGFEQVILYATHDGQKTYASDGAWYSDLFAGLWSDLDKDDRATGEAHLLDIAGGGPLVSATADAAPRDPLNLFDGGRNPERETLAKLVSGIEMQLMSMARAAYEAQRSISDGNR
jgi:hypothetical protein